MYLLPYIGFCASLTLASFLQPLGWLGRLVQFHKHKFLNEVQELTPVNIKATVIPMQPDFKDSDAWDYDSVIRLLLLIRQSEAAAPARRALRRMLPSRRYMSKAQSYKYFPSWFKNSKNEFYYDISNEYEEESGSTSRGGLVDESAVIVVANPVEARLPSSQISVSLLKQILENRAYAARIMPSTTMRTWATVPKKNVTKATSAKPDGETTQSDDAAAEDDSPTTQSGNDNEDGDATKAPDAAETEAAPDAEPAGE